MRQAIDQLVGEFTDGRITRRELVRRLAILTTAAGLPAARPQEAPPSPKPPFKAVGLNHIALRVADVARSRDFYRDLLGMTPASESLPGSCFLNAKGAFLALFRGDKPAMDHYCWSVEGYDVKSAEAKLLERKIKPRVVGNRIYFPDPDGLEVQLSDPAHGL